MAAASSTFANTSYTSQTLRRSPRTSKRDQQVMPQSHCFETKVCLESETSHLEPKNVVETTGRKRKRNQSKLKNRGSSTAEQDIPAAERKDDRIRFLEDENKALKIENKALKKKLLKEYACPICERSYIRSENLYTHLKEGDKEHKRLAEERYKTKCEICGKEYTRWGDLKKHMAKHEQKRFESADNLNLESAASMFLVASFGIGFFYQIDRH